MNGGQEGNGSHFSLNGRSHPSASASSELFMRSPQDDEDEFDALVRSNETMKVSLTPSRLKTFEISKVVREDGQAKTSGRTSPQNAFRRNRLSPGGQPAPSLPAIDGLPMPRASRAEFSRTPTRPGNRSRAGSAKFLPRGATTIKEQKDEEEDAFGTQQPRKESLIELLQSEPAVDGAPSGTTGSPSSSLIRRTVPAVVLGTPPPPAAAGMFSSQLSPSLNRPDREFLDIGDNDEKKVKQKTSAEELADFFKNTPAPRSTTSPTPPKSKGFKSFMSKVTGKKSEDRAPTPTLATSASQTSLNLGESIQPRRQKTLQNVGSMSAPPSAFRITDSVPLLPNIGLLRKRSRDSASATTPERPAAVVEPTTTPLDTQPNASTESATLTKEGSERKIGVGSGVETNSTTPSAQPVVLPPIAKPIDLPLLRQLVTEHLGPSTNDILSAPSSSSRSASPIADQQKSLTAGSLATLPTMSSQSQRMPTVSDANSFVTANEGEETVESPVEQPLVEPTGRTGEPTGVPIADATGETTGEHEEDATARENTPIEMGEFAIAPVAHGPSDSVKSRPPEPVMPSIPLSDLTPLHTVLQHATSARECQLLLSAILSQWGIPLPAESPAAEHTPESRVTAWLLAGRDGPITGDTPSSSTFSKVDEEVITPKLDQAARLPSIAHPVPTSNSNDEEILSSETTSEVSASEEDVRENVTPSFAKLARMSSSSLQPVETRELPSALDVRTNEGIILVGI